MRPRVDFYVLKTEDAQGLRVMACRLIEKIYKQGYTVFVCLDSEEDVQHLDGLLWTFRQGSFVPHALCSDADEWTPVLLGSLQVKERPAREVMVNLSSAIPENVEQFSRIADLVNQAPKIRAEGRLRYRAYRDQGLQIETHTL